MRNLGRRFVGTSRTLPRDCNDLRFIGGALDGVRILPFMMIRNKRIEDFFTMPIQPSSHPRPVANYGTWTLRHPSAAAATGVAPSIPLKPHRM